MKNAKNDKHVTSIPSEVVKNVAMLPVIVSDMMSLQLLPKGMPVHVTLWSFDDGDPLGSDCEVEDDKFDDGEIIRPNKKGSHHSEYKCITSNNVGETEDLNGFLWEKDIDIPPPEDKSCLGESQIKSKYKGLFETE
eukprot:14022227-Ditylum_brightwellii.AAC.1